MEDRIMLFQVRVMFKFMDKDTINFKIVTDTESGIKSFVDNLKQVKDIERIAVEYLCEYDCSKLYHTVNINCLGGDNNETV